jgi:Zn-finger nucleic acid-binding protein
MLCPRDGDLLEHQAYFKYPRWACATCKGVFVAERDLSENIGHKKAPKSVEAIAGVKLDSVTKSEIRCPKDDTALRALHFATCEVDVCPACKGLWLDHGEYEKIVRRMSERLDKERGEPMASRKAPLIEQGNPSLTVDDVLGFLGGVWKSYKRWDRIL